MSYINLSCIWPTPYVTNAMNTVNVLQSRLLFLAKMQIDQKQRKKLAGPRLIIKLSFLAIALFQMYWNTPSISSYRFFPMENMLSSTR